MRGAGVQKPHGAGRAARIAPARRGRQAWQSVRRGGRGRGARCLAPPTRKRHRRRPCGKVGRNVRVGQRGGQYCALSGGVLSSLAQSPPTAGSFVSLPGSFFARAQSACGTELFDGRRLVRADPRRVGRRRAVVEPSRVEGRLRCAARVRRLWRRRCQARAGQGGLCGPGPSSAVPPSGACGGASTARAAGAALGVPVDLFGTRCPALSPALEPRRRARTACQEA